MHKDNLTSVVLKSVEQTIVFGPWTIPARHFCADLTLERVSKEVCDCVLMLLVTFGWRFTHDQLGEVVVWLKNLALGIEREENAQANHNMGLYEPVECRTCRPPRP